MFRMTHLPPQRLSHTCGACEVVTMHDQPGAGQARRPWGLGAAMLWGGGHGGHWAGASGEC